MALLVCMLAVAAGTAIVWWGSSWLEAASRDLAEHYQLPPVVRGTIITAVGSSFPELSSAVLATWLHGDFELGVGAIAGSAIFNILAIPAMCAILAGRLEAGRLLVYKDAQFYITSVAVLLLAFCFAVLYHPVAGPGLQGEMTRTIAAMPLLLYLLYLFLQQQDTQDHRREAGGATAEGGGAGGRAWARLGAGLVAILVGVEALVRSAIWLGDHFGTPSFLWGLTVVAIATSVPDAFVSLRMARRGEGDVGLANVLGSNIFDLLVAVPAGVLVAGSTVVHFDIAAPLLAALTLATILLFTLLRVGLGLSRREGWVLAIGYAAFLLWMGLEFAGVSRLLEAV